MKLDEDTLQLWMHLEERLHKKRDSFFSHLFTCDTFSPVISKKVLNADKDMLLNGKKFKTGQLNFLSSSSL